MGHGVDTKLPAGKIGQGFPHDKTPVPVQVARMVLRRRLALIFLLYNDTEGIGQRGTPIALQLKPDIVVDARRVLVVKRRAYMYRFSAGYPPVLAFRQRLSSREGAHRYRSRRSIMGNVRNYGNKRGIPWRRIHGAHTAEIKTARLHGRCTDTSSGDPPESHSMTDRPWRPK